VTAALAADDRPYGWLGRIGVVAPSINSCIEPQFRALAPPGVEFHVTRLRLRSGDRAELLAMGESAGAAAELLADVDPDLVLFQCTAATTIGGPSYEADLIARVAVAAGRPATSTGSAVVAALRTLGVERIALITPYEPEINAAEARFLDGHGLRVVEPWAWRRPPTRACRRPGGSTWSGAPRLATPTPCSSAARTSARWR
jgi:maleate cis-trans isomerase